MATSLEASGNRPGGIPVTRSSLPAFGDFEREAAEIWAAHRLTGFGPESRKLEEEISWEIMAPAYLTTSGDMALYLAIQAVVGQFFLSAGDLPEIITTPFTFLSTVGAIVRCNCRPVFADIDPVTFCLDPKEIERHITKNTRAILAVHVFGNVCNDAAIREIADAYHLKVIYDAAHAFGERLIEVQETGDGRRNLRHVVSARSVLTLGDASCCSLNATKVCNSAEGGFAVFRDPEAGERFRRLSNFGLCCRENADLIGCNGKQDELRSALGVCNVKRLPETIRKRRGIAERYVSRLSGIRRVRCCLAGEEQDGNEDLYETGDRWNGGSNGKAPEGQKRQRLIRNYAYFPICVPERDRLCRALEENGIYPRKYFYPLVPSMTAFRNLPGCAAVGAQSAAGTQGVKEAPGVTGAQDRDSLQGVTKGRTETPVAEEVSRRLLALPIYEDLPLCEVDRICDVIEETM